MGGLLVGRMRHHGQARFSVSDRRSAHDAALDRQQLARIHGDLHESRPDTCPFDAIAEFSHPALGQLRGLGLQCPCRQVRFLVEPRVGNDLEPGKRAEP